MDYRVISVLIGLAGAVANNPKTENTDRVVVDALSGRMAGAKALEAVRREKFAVAPNCAACHTPCGSVADYDMERYYSAPEDIRGKKAEIAELLHSAAENYSGNPEPLYRGLVFFGLDLRAEDYDAVINELKNYICGGKNVKKSD